MTTLTEIEQFVAAKIADNAKGDVTAARLRQALLMLTNYIAGKDGDVRVVTQSATLRVDDVGKTLRMTSVDPITLTVPADAEAAIPIDAEFEVGQMSTGALSIVAGAGVVIHSAYGLVFDRLYLYGRLRKIGSDRWSLSYFGLPASVDPVSNGGHVVSRAYGDPPVSPPDGSVYIVPTTGLSGVFVDHEGELARYHGDTGTYTFKSPEGATVLVLEEGKVIFYNGSAWFEAAGGAAPAVIPVLGSPAGGPVAYTATGSADFEMIASRMFLWDPPQTNDNNPTLTITKPDSSVIGPFGVFDRDGTSITRNILGYGPVLCEVRTAVSFRVLVGAGQIARAKNFDVIQTDGRHVGRITFSGGNISIEQSTDGTTAGLREVANISAANGEIRALYGFKTGKTAGISVPNYSPLNPQPTGALNLGWQELKTLITGNTGPSTNEPALPRDVSSAVPQYLTVIDAQRGGVKILTGTAAKFDARLLFPDKPVRIYTEPGATTAAINIGSGNTWLGHAAGEIMATFSDDTLFQIWRVDDKKWAYHVIKGAAPAVTATPRWTAIRAIITSGQSQIKLATDGGLAEGFRLALEEYNAVEDVLIIPTGSNGSAMVQHNSSSASNYWINYADNDPGPLLLAWKAAIDAWVLEGQPIPVADFRNQGSTDVLKMVKESAGAAPGATTYSLAIAKLQAEIAWRRAQFPGLKIGLVPLGSDDTSGIDDRHNTLRLAQLKAIRGDADAFRCIDYYDLMRPDSAFFGIGSYHLTFVAQVSLGYRMGLDYLKNIRGIAIASSGPFIESVTLIAPGQYRVLVNTGYASPSITGRDDNPTNVEGFGLYEASNPDPMEWVKYPIDQIRWSGGSGGAPYEFMIYSEAAAEAISAVVVYPDGSIATGAATRRLIMQKSAPRLPMQVYDVAP